MLIFSDKTYDFIKKLVQVILPAVGALYFGLAGIWGLPASEQVVGTIAVVNTFLGVCLGISHNVYNNSPAAYDGQMVVTDDEGVKNHSLEINGDPGKLSDKKDIRLKVVNKT